MNNVKKILLINFGGIGDEILFLPTLETIRKNYPKATIFLAVEPRSKSIADLSQAIDCIIEVDIKSKNKYFNLLKLLITAWLERFDLVISSGANKSIPLLLTLMGAKERYGYNSGILAEKLLTKAITLNKQQYAGDMYHDLVSHIEKKDNNIPKIELETFKI